MGSFLTQVIPPEVFDVKIDFDSGSLRPEQDQSIGARAVSDFMVEATNSYNFIIKFRFADIKRQKLKAPA